MINRYSEERIVRRGALTPGFAPADEPWFRFDYVADDLTYPLAVRWAPEAAQPVATTPRKRSVSTLAADGLALIASYRPALSCNFANKCASQAVRLPLI
jgi:hypothetical protein